MVCACLCGALSLLCRDVPTASGAGGGSLPAGYDCGQEEGLLGVEDLFGPGNVNGISGNGSLSPSAPIPNTLCPKPRASNTNT